MGCIDSTSIPYSGIFSRWAVFVGALEFDDSYTIVLTQCRSAHSLKSLLLHPVLGTVHRPVWGHTITNFSLEHGGWRKGVKEGKQLKTRRQQRDIEAYLFFRTPHATAVITGIMIMMIISIASGFSLSLPVKQRRPLTRISRSWTR